MTKKIILFSLCILSILNAFSQVFNDPEFDRQAKKGIQLLYNFEFDKAEAAFLPLKEKYPNHPAPYFFLATNRWWQNYICAKTPLYYGFVDNMIEKAIELNERTGRQAWLITWNTLISNS